MYTGRSKEDSYLYNETDDVHRKERTGSLPARNLVMQRQPSTVPHPQNIPNIEQRKETNLDQGSPPQGFG